MEGHKPEKGNRRPNKPAISFPTVAGTIAQRLEAHVTSTYGGLTKCLVCYRGKIVGIVVVIVVKDASGGRNVRGRAITSERLSSEAFSSGMISVSVCHNSLLWI